MTRQLRVALLGNTDPDIYWSTENEYVDAYTRAGHQVDAYQEQKVEDWDALIRNLNNGVEYDLIHWTRTKSFADAAGEDRQQTLLNAAAYAGVTVIGVHLDRWWGLEREAQLVNDPYFTGVDIMFTADGAHQDEWEKIGVNHRWLLPAISERWLGAGEVRPEYECDIVFVGGWKDYGHRAWKHRAQLIAHVDSWYGAGCACKKKVKFLPLPRPRQPRIVGRDLNDVYASAKIVLGDSCLVPRKDGNPMVNYCSDRIPETLGRGGILIHPAVHGINSLFGDPFDTATWPLNDWKALRQTLDTMLEYADDTLWNLRVQAIDDITERHTYTHRVNEIVEVLEKEGRL